MLKTGDKVMVFIPLKELANARPLVQFDRKVSTVTGSRMYKTARKTTFRTYTLEGCKSPIGTDYEFVEEWLIPCDESEEEMTQSERVMKYIDEFGSISSMEAFADLGITRLSARVFELEKKGVRFNRKQEAAKNRYGEKVYYTRYSIAE